MNEKKNVVKKTNKKDDHLYSYRSLSNDEDSLSWYIVYHICIQQLEDESNLYIHICLFL